MKVWRQVVWVIQVMWRFRSKMIRIWEKGLGSKEQGFLVLVDYGCVNPL